MLSNASNPIPVLGWQNVALSSLGSVCQATSEFSSDYLCTKALDGLTHVMSQWATRFVGAGTLFHVRHVILTYYHSVLYSTAAFQHLPWLISWVPTQFVWFIHPCLAGLIHWHIGSHEKASIHYNDIIMSAMASKSPVSRLFTQPFIQAQIKENTKAPRHWPLCEEFTGDRWIPAQNVSNAEKFPSDDVIMSNKIIQNYMGKSGPCQTTTKHNKTLAYNLWYLQIRADRINSHHSVNKCNSYVRISPSYVLCPVYMKMASTWWRALI